jgi:hypothetical protein
VADALRRVFTDGWHVRAEAPLAAPDASIRVADLLP